MNLELLRELATVDPELLEHDTGFFHETFAIKGAHGRKFSFLGPSEDIKDEDWDPVIKVHYDIEQAEAEKIFFFALLERIQARGWKLFLIVKPEGHFATIYPYREAGTLTPAHQYKALGEAIESSPCEALAHAYVQACKS